MSRYFSGHKLCSYVKSNIRLTFFPTCVMLKADLEERRVTVERVILHCDLNSFFASVELLEHPELREKPVAVCGNPSTRHGIILAKNEVAKRFQVQTAETVWQARKKCPDLILLPSHHAKYRAFSQRVNSIYQRYTDLVEPFGIDESWLDVTGTLHLFGKNGRELADELRAVLRSELGLTISVGVSFNKVFAKLGSDYRKPNATTVIAPSNWKPIIWPLPVSDLLFVGRAATRILNRYGIFTIGQLANANQALLVTLLGKQGAQLHDYARGLDTSPVRPAGQRPPPKSVGNGMTFRHNLTEWAELRSALDLLCDSVATRLRQSQMKCASVQITLRDSDFQTITRQAPLSPPTNLARELATGAMALLRKNWHPHKPVRMLTITGLRLIPEWDAVEQLDLFQPDSHIQRAKLEQLERTVDSIRAKYGSDAIVLGSVAAQSDLYGGSDDTPEQFDPS